MNTINCSYFTGNIFTSLLTTRASLWRQYTNLSCWFIILEDDMGAVFVLAHNWHGSVHVAGRWTRGSSHVDARAYTLLNALNTCLSASSPLLLYVFVRILERMLNTTACAIEIIKIQHVECDFTSCSSLRYWLKYVWNIRLCVNGNLKH